MGTIDLPSGTTAQFGGASGDVFSAICGMQISRFTSSKPSKFAFASDEKSIRRPTTSFVQRCLKTFVESESAEPIYGGQFLAYGIPQIVRDENDAQLRHGKQAGFDVQRGCFVQRGGALVQKDVLHPANQGAG